MTRASRRQSVGLDVCQSQRCKGKALSSFSYLAVALKLVGLVQVIMCKLYQRVDLRLHRAKLRWILLLS